MSKLYVKNLQEYISAVDVVSQKYKSICSTDSPIWFRGQCKTTPDYFLQPNIYRRIGEGKEQNGINRRGTYGTLWLKEEQRYQFFSARNYDKIPVMPDSLIEWQEIMQHYLSKTRLMDWSESAIIALAFALEPFIDPTDTYDNQIKRKKSMPVVWTLNPVELNNRVYSCMEKNKDLVNNACKEFSKFTRSEIIRELNNRKDIYFNLDEKYNGGVNGLVSMSGLENLRNSYGERMYNAVKELSFNPFYYLLLRYYSDGIKVDVDELPPLAIIHPYHSKRIHEQKGAFTIFPYYEKVKTLGKTSPYAMEYMRLCVGCLHEILIVNPDNMARQLKDIGVRQYHLYPEMDNVTKDYECES